MHVLSTYDPIPSSVNIILTGRKIFLSTLFLRCMCAVLHGITLKNENKPLSIESVRSPFLVLPSSGTQKV